MAQDGHGQHRANTRQRKLDDGGGAKSFSGGQPNCSTRRDKFQPSTSSLDYTETTLGEHTRIALPFVYYLKCFEWKTAVGEANLVHLNHDTGLVQVGHRTR